MPAARASFVSGRLVVPLFLDTSSASRVPSPASMRVFRFVLKLIIGVVFGALALAGGIGALIALGVISPGPKPTIPTVQAQPTVARAPVAPPHRAPAPPPPSAAPPEHHWYEGGTLSGAGAIEWQKATPENKLASCADMLAKLWMGGRLAPNLAGRIHTVDDLQEPARQLRQGLDKAFIGDPDPKMNAKTLTNQTVSETAIVVLSLMHWLKV